MSFFNLFKKDVPDELPDLATDEIEKKLETKELKESKEQESEELKESKEIVKDYLTQEEKSEKIKKVEKKLEEVKEKPIEKEIEKVRKLLPKNTENTEESFFNKLQEDINKEATNLNKLESWYNNKFLPQDIVSEMRNYWERQKAGSVVKVIGRNFKDRVTEKTNKLQQLEKEWQNIYFDLIEKEEEMREQERELKSVLAEFVELCKKRTKRKGKKK